MHDNHTEEPVWLSEKDKQTWQHSEGEAQREALVAKPFESLPVTGRNAPAITNGLPDEV